MTVKTLPEPKLDARDAKRAMGRPMKPPTRGKRAPLSLLVRPETKRLVDRLATRDGTTQSAMAEYLIEQGIAVRQVLDAVGKTLQEIESGNLRNVHAALLRAGFTVERWRDPADGKIWKSYREPGYPPVVSDGAFVTAIAQEGEQK